MSESEQKVLKSYLSQASKTFEGLADINIALDDKERLRQRLDDFGLEECNVNEEDDVFSALSVAIFGTENEHQLLRNIIYEEVKSVKHGTLYKSMIEGKYDDYCNDIIMMSKKPMNKLLALKASCEAFLVRAVVFGSDHETCVTMYTPTQGEYRKVIYVSITSDFLKPLCSKQETGVAERDAIASLMIDNSPVHKHGIEWLWTVNAKDLKECCPQIFPMREKSFVGFGDEEMNDRLSLLGLTKKITKHPDYWWNTKAGEEEEFNETLLRSLSDQLFGDEDKCQYLRFIVYCQLRMNTNTYRDMVADWTRNRNDFNWFCYQVSERQLSVHDLFVQAIADVYRVRILELGIHPDVLIKETLPYIQPYKKVLFICRTKFFVGSIDFRS